MCRSGVPGDEFARSKAEVSAEAARDRERDEWWLNTVLPYACWQPFRISWVAGGDADYRAIAAAEVDSLAKSYLVKARAFAVVGTSAPRPHPAPNLPSQKGSGKGTHR